MSFLFLISLGTAVAWIAARLAGMRIGLQDSMRCGMGLGFVFTGIDHFLNGTTRYVPMMPELLAEHALAWVYFTGAAELAGGIGLLAPRRFYQRLGMPSLHRPAGAGLAILLVCVVAANVSVAVNGQAVQGLEFGAWYFWTRPLFQPVFVAWALFCVGIWPRRGDARSAGRDSRAQST